MFLNCTAKHMWPQERKTQGHSLFCDLPLWGTYKGSVPLLVQGWVLQGQKLTIAQEAEMATWCGNEPVLFSKV